MKFKNFRNDPVKILKTLLSKIFYQIPLLILVAILIWSQYTISISLFLNYFILIRKIYKIPAMIWFPFQLSWISTILNLSKCILIGPGWVESQSFRKISSDFNHIPSNLNPHSPSFQTNQIMLDGDDNQSEDNDEIDQLEDGRIPLLSHQHLTSNRPQSPSLSTLAPRQPTYSPSSSSLLPFYLIKSHPAPPANLNFQSQVERAKVNYLSSQDPLLVALNKSPPQSSNNSLPITSDMETLMCKSDGSRRYCRKCQLYKADRSHHCNSCGRCVLRMDHHCPWLGSRCVGLTNHKFFILFLISSAFTAILSFIGSINGLADFVTVNQTIIAGEGLRFSPLNWAFLVLVSALFSMVLTGFTAYHLYLVSVNRTTIENLERSSRVRPTLSTDLSTSYALLKRSTPNQQQDSQVDFELNSDRNLPSYHLPIYKSDYQLTRAERRRLEEESSRLNVYNLGSLRHNFCEIFGRQSKWWEWLLPVKPKGISDGYRYEVNEEHLSQLRQLTAEVRLLPNDRANELLFERP
ncbi:hypothetical protein O181_008649 [Austropuccinia psidii MF-1]|uniref:Palmitoyltransferase n=1 Tax=Austropuccinia psidii MF-1 TaxID=1389203 RepID=A0A9Q3BP96_9BASI|nr:hypothetical protein [Austropuccinia psidii MF-1]